MRVFVTGAAGGLGRALVDTLLGAGHDVAALTRGTGGSLAGASVVRGDLLAPETYRRALEGVECVVHMAAVTHSADPDLYYAVNARGTEALLEAAEAAGVARFLHVSTRAVGRACGAYGDSKALAEEAVRRCGMQWTIFRPAEVYMASGREAVWRMVENVRAGRAVPVVADARALLAPVHRDDVVAAMAAALARPESIGGTYVLAGPEEFTQAALAERLMRCFGRRVPVLPVPVALLRAAAAAFRLLRLARPPFVPDQIERLLCRKEVGFEAAGRDLGFAPRPVEQGLGPAPSGLGERQNEGVRS